MTVRIVATADTHLPGRARDLPSALWDAIDDADLVIHAGDWVGIDLLDALQSRSRQVLGVFGNNDGADLRRRLPEVARGEIEGRRIAVTHETGPSVGRERRCDAMFPGVDVLFFGHSHIPWDSATPMGMRLLNPGSPTDRRRQPAHTFLTLVVDGGHLRDVTLHTL